MSYAYSEYVFFKVGNTYYRVTTCDCCNIDGFRDAWSWKPGDERPHSIGVRRSMFKGKYPLSLDQVREQAPRLVREAVE